MANEHIIGLRLTADNKESVAAIKQVREEQDKLGQSTRALNSEAGKLASQYGMTAQALNSQSVAAVEVSRDVQRLLDRYDPLGTKLRSLESDFARLNAAASKGLIGKQNDAAVDKTYTALNAEILRTKALMVDAGVATDGGATSMKGLGLNTQYARRELMQLGKEALMGDFSQMPGTFASLVTHSNLLAAATSPVGIAIGVVAAATVVGLLAFENYTTNIKKMREELVGLEGDLQSQSIEKLNKILNEYNRLADEKRKSSQAGGFGWIQDAKEAGVYEERARAVTAQINAGLRLTEKLEKERGDPHGEASKLAAGSDTAARRELERKIALMEEYYSKQVDGSKAEIDALSVLAKLNKELNAEEKKRTDARLKAQEGADAYLKKLKEETENIGASADALKRLNNERAISDKQLGPDQAKQARVLTEEAILKENYKTAYELGIKTEDDIAAYKRQMADNKKARDIDDINDLVKERDKADARAALEYKKQVEANADMFTQSITQGLKNGEGALETFAKALGSSVEKAMTDAMSKAITSTVMNATGDDKATKTDWIMAIVGIVALISTAARNTATAAEIAKVTASEVQRMQGTGSITGDYLAQSHSISESMMLLIDSTLQTSKYSVTMISHLQSIDSAMSSFVTAAAIAIGGDIAATMGVARDEKYSSGLTRGYGDLQTPLQNAIRDVVWGTHTSTVTDSGLTVNGTIASLAQGSGVGIYASGTNTNSGLFGTGIGGSSSTWTQTAGASAALSESIASIYTGISESFKAMALNMGMSIKDVDAAVDGFATTIGKLSFEGLSAADKIKALEAAISKDADLLAQKLFPSMIKFNVAGEGMFETVVRVNQEIENADAFFVMLGRDIKSTAESADALTIALGGVDSAATKMRSFIDTFAPVEVAVTNSRKALEALGFENLDSMTTTEAWWALMQTANEEQLITILNNQPAIEAYIAAIDKQKSATESATSALKAETDAKIKAAQAAYTDAVAAKDALKAASVAVRDLIDSISGATSGGLQDRFAITNALAASGDTAAQGKLGEAANAYLESAAAGASSALEVARATAYVQAALNTTALAIEGTVSAAEATLTAAQEANGFLAEIKVNTGDTKNNITALAYALDALPPAIVGANGTVSDAMVAAMAVFNTSVTNAYAQLSAAITNGYSDIAAALSNTTPPPQVVVPQVSAPVPVVAPPVAAPAPDRTNIDPIASAYADAQAELIRKQKADAIKEAEDAYAALNTAKLTLSSFLSRIGEFGSDNIFMTMADAVTQGYAGPVDEYDRYLAAVSTAQTASDAASKKYFALFPVSTRSFDVGSNYIPYDMLANIHEGEEITPRPYVDMQRAARDETNRLLEELRKEVKTLRENQQRDNSSLKETSKATADLLDNISAGGGPLLVQVTT